MYIYFYHQCVFLCNFTATLRRERPLLVYRCCSVTIHETLRSSFCTDVALFLPSHVHGVKAISCFCSNYARRNYRPIAVKTLYR